MIAAWASRVIDGTASVVASLKCHLAACALILTAVTGHAALIGVGVTLRQSDDPSGSNPYFLATTTVGPGIEGQAFFLNGAINEFIDISDSQIVLGLSFSSIAAQLPIPHFWVLDFQSGTNIASLSELSDSLPSGVDVVSFGKDSVTLQLNPMPTINGPFTLTATYAVTLVPEPSTYALFLAGILVVGFASGRRIKLVN